MQRIFLFACNKLSLQSRPLTLQHSAALPLFRDFSENGISRSSQCRQISKIISNEHLIAFIYILFATYIPTAGAESYQQHLLL